jgi:hypothetical protein
MKSINVISSFNDVKEDYLPEDQSETYLEDSFVLDVVQSVKHQGATNPDALDYIIKMEKIHKKFVCGEITSNDEKEYFKEINRSFRNKYSIWLHETSECILFYNLLNGSEVLSL